MYTRHGMHIQSDRSAALHPYPVYKVTSVYDESSRGAVSSRTRVIASETAPRIYFAPTSITDAQARPLRVW